MQVGYFFPMADETTPEPRDKIADYNEKLAAALALPLEEGFVDPHVEAIGKGKGPDFDVDPRGDPDADVNGSRDFSEDGPSEAELRQGDEEEGEQSGFPVDEDEGQQGGNDGLPTDEDEEQQIVHQQTQQQEKPVVATDTGDVVADLAAKLIAANPQLSPENALAIAEARDKKAREAADVVVDDTNEYQPGSEEIPDLGEPDDLRAKRKELDKQWRNAVKDLADDDAIAEIEKQIEEVDDLIPQAIEAKAKRTERVVSQFQAAAQKAVALYPDAEKEGSPLYVRMAEIHATMEQTGDSTINHPQKALLIAQMAARELRIAPRAVVAPSSPPAQRTAATRAKGVAPMTAPLAPRGARTTAPAVNQLEKAISEIRTPEQYAAFMRRTGVRA